MKKVLTLLIIITFNFSFSLQGDIARGDKFIDISIRGEALLSGNPFKEPVKALGTPYISEEFSLAKVNNSKKLYLARYNAHQDVFEIKKSENDIIVLDSKDEYAISFKDIEYTTVTFENSKRSFMSVIWNDNEYALLSKNAINFTPAVKAKTSYDSDVVAKYSEVVNKLYVDLGQGVIEIPRSKKKFYKIFPNNSKNMQQFVKNEKLNIKNQKDLIKILKYYIN